MGVSRRHAERVTPGWLVGARIVGLVGAAAVVSVAAVTAYVARQIIVPPKKRDEDVMILGVDRAGSSIDLSVTPDTVLPGRYSLWFSRDRGHLQLGEVIEVDESRVRREIIGVDFGDLAHAHRGRIAGWWYLHPRDLEFYEGHERVDVHTELGDAPAWLIPAQEAESDKWVIQVHGRAARRQEGLRAVRVFRDAGYHSLLISYRNDGDAPFSADGRYSLGDTEWGDVESALHVAMERGARHVVLMGWSMGGATALQALTRSPLAPVIRGVVLESPVVDWVSTLDDIAGQLGVPRAIRSAAYAVIGAPWGRMLTGQRDPIDLARLDFVRRAEELTVPILLLHSDDDGFVPSAASHELAKARPDIVTFVPFARARHTKLWNYDPETWEGAIAAWLRQLPYVGGATAQRL